MVEVVNVKPPVLVVVVVVEVVEGVEDALPETIHPGSAGTAGTFTGETGLRTPVVAGITGTMGDTERVGSALALVPVFALVGELTGATGETERVGGVLAMPLTLVVGVGADAAAVKI